MQTPDDVAAMLRLYQLGWGTRRIAQELGCSKNTVKHYLRQGGWAPARAPRRQGVLAGLEEWLAGSFRQHRGNADVVRQELKRVQGLEVSLRTVERAVRPLRQELQAQARATVRFETPPGRQLQIDFGTTGIVIGDRLLRARLFVATLGYSRRNFVTVFTHERQSAWLEGLERTFHHFGGVPEEVLLDNPRALVTYHSPHSREVVFNDRFLAFTRYWGFRPWACAPYRARTKGKDESGVKYVKRNAIAGRTFPHWAGLEAHLSAWMREIADVRVHGSTGEVPLERFMGAEAAALQPLAGRPPFDPLRELTRRVQADACIELDTDRYSVPWRLIGEAVTVQASEAQVCVLHAGAEVARHPRGQGCRQRLVEARHLSGLVSAPAPCPDAEPPASLPPPALPELLRPLSDYEVVAGGGW